MNDIKNVFEKNNFKLDRDEWIHKKDKSIVVEVIEDKKDKSITVKAPRFNQ